MILHLLADKYENQVLKSKNLENDLIETINHIYKNDLEESQLKRIIHGIKKLCNKEVTATNDVAFLIEKPRQEINELFHNSYNTTLLQVLEHKRLPIYIKILILEIYLKFQIKTSKGENIFYEPSFFFSCDGKTKPDEQIIKELMVKRENLIGQVSDYEQEVLTKIEKCEDIVKVILKDLFIPYPTKIFLKSIFLSDIFLLGNKAKLIIKKIKIDDAKSRNTILKTDTDYAYYFKSILLVYLFLLPLYLEVYEKPEKFPVYDTKLLQLTLATWNSINEYHSIREMNPAIKDIKDIVETFDRHYCITPKK
ncbi:MAG: hypothetical protein NTY22_08085 [Proteobacteria bacterium]|nr:hypothetical protein [Pseudomonadota bacterium]